MFGRRKKQDGTEGWSHHQTGGIIAYLVEVLMPFVTSQTSNFHNCLHLHVPFRALTERTETHNATKTLLKGKFAQYKNAASHFCLVST